MLVSPEVWAWIVNGKNVTVAIEVSATVQLVIAWQVSIRRGLVIVRVPAVIVIVDWRNWKM